MMSLIPIPQSCLSLSSLCLGAGAFSPGMAQGLTERLYAAFREAGGNCFDTAHCYSFWLPDGLGAPERLLGAAIRRHNDRRNVCIISKGGHPAVLPGYPRPDRYLDPAVLESDIAESLERLGTDWIDLYCLHRDDARVPVGEILDALGGHIAAGRLRAIGASNWSIARLAEANAWAARHGKPGFVASQVEFSLAFSTAADPTTDPAMRHMTEDGLAWHTASGLPVLCYASTAGGYFASGGQRGGGHDNPASRERLRRAGELAGQLGASANQIALAYLMHQPFAAIPILGTANPEHLADAIGAAKVRLTQEQVRWLGEPSPLSAVAAPG